MLLRDLTADLLPPRAALLSHDVVLMALPEGGPRGDAHPVIPGHPALVPPYGTVAVEGTAGPHRIAAMRLPAGRMERRRLDPTRRGATPLDLSALSTDAVELADELDAASCRRLLGFLLGFCRTAFGLGGDAGFADTCIRLARLCARDAGFARPVAYATPSWMVLEGVQAPLDLTLYLLGGGRVRHSAAPTLPGETGLRLIEPVRGGELLLALGDQPSLWTVQAPTSTLPDVLQFFRGTPGTAMRTACLRALAPAGGRAAALLREMQVLAPAVARRHDDTAHPLGAALDVAFPDGEGGLFLHG